MSDFQEITAWALPMAIVAGIIFQIPLGMFILIFGLCGLALTIILPIVDKDYMELSILIGVVAIILTIVGWITRTWDIWDFLKWLF